MEGFTQAERYRPHALKPGDKVGIIAPAGAIDRDVLEAGCAWLERKGYEPIYLPSILDRELYFAGSERRRIDEFHEMFSRRDIQAIICARGGYGCNYLLPHIDLELIRANPKIFVGCSDITTLLTYLCDRAQMVVFHGPMLNVDIRPDGVDDAAWSASLSSGEGWERSFSSAEVETLVPGSAEGMLYGGCLSLLCASLGTPYEIETDDTILFIEDLAEPAFRIDRMLMQLKLAEKFTGVRGIIFGEMLNCGRNADYPIREVVKRVVSDFGVPVAYGLKSGHVSGGNIMLPLGVPARLTAGENVALSLDRSVQLLVPASTNHTP
jgi:muramoyltetrapeptide carboxypeptidase